MKPSIDPRALRVRMFWLVAVGLAVASLSSDRPPHLSAWADERDSLLLREREDSSSGPRDPWLLTRTLQHNRIRIPCVFSPEGVDHPLRVLEPHLVGTDPTAARVAFRRLHTGLRGRLLPAFRAPGESSDAEGRWVRVPAPSEVLRDWYEHAKGAAAEASPPTGSAGADEEALRETNVALWHPGARPDARREFEKALESAHWGRALRLLEALPRQSLSPEFESEVVAWMRTSTTDRTQPSRVPSRLRSSLPTGTPEPGRCPQKLELRFQLPLDPEREAVPSPDNPEPLRVRVSRRLAPLSLAYPLLGPGEAVFVVGPRAVGLSVGPSPRVSWDIAPLQGGVSQPGLKHLTSAPVATPAGVLFPLRGSLPESPLLVPASHRDSSSWRTWGLYRKTPGQAPTPSQGKTARLLASLTDEGSTVAAPWIDEDVVVQMSVQGWNELEVTLHAGLRSTGERTWSRPLGALEVPWLASHDLRCLVPEGELFRHGEDLIAVPGTGWIARVDRLTGQHRGTLLYERAGRDALPFHPVLTIDRTRFRQLPAPRPRAPGPRLWTQSPAGRPLLVILPPDSQHLLAIDPVSWTIAWAHGPISTETILLGGEGKSAWLLDTGIDCEQRTLGLKKIDTATGRLLGTLPLIVPGQDSDPPTRVRRPRSSPPTPTGPADLVARDAPLLAGVPRLTRDQLWVPGRKALLAWDCETLEVSRGETPIEPDQVTEWPVGAQGGTPIPLRDGQILCFSRGFMRDGTGPVIELLGAATKKSQ